MKKLRTLLRLLRDGLSQGTEAFELGHRLYAERLKEFSRRLGRYWKAWRG